jgi:hypothetical protein
METTHHADVISLPDNRLEIETRVVSIVETALGDREAVEVGLAELITPRPLSLHPVLAQAARNGMLVLDCALAPQLRPSIMRAKMPSSSYRIH